MSDNTFRNTYLGDEHILMKSDNDSIDELHLALFKSCGQTVHVNRCCFILDNGEDIQSEVDPIVNLEHRLHKTLSENCRGSDNWVCCLRLSYNYDKMSELYQSAGNINISGVLSSFLDESDEEVLRYRHRLFAMTKHGHHLIELWRHGLI